MTYRILADFPMVDEECVGAPIVELVRAFISEGQPYVAKFNPRTLEREGPLVECDTASDALILALHNAGWSYTATDLDGLGVELADEDAIVEVFAR